MAIYGSVINACMAQTSAQTLTIGMGVTACYWSDREAYEIIAIKDDKHITVRRLHCEMKPGTDWLDQEYNYSPDPNGHTVNLYRTAKGWRERIGRNGLGDIRFSVGYANEYRDPCF